MALAFVSLNLLPGMFALAMVFIILLTVGEMVGMPFMNTYWIDRANNSNRGQYAALFTMSWAVAQVTGPGMGALIAQYGGFTTLWWVIAGICLVAIAGYRWLQLRTKAR